MQGQGGAWSRRRFLGALLATGAVSVLPVRRLLAGEEPIRISILHTTDLHGHILPTTSYEGVPDLGGLARCATQIRAWRADNPLNLLVDVGDIYQGTDVGLRTRGKIMTDSFALLGYDAWTVGNHEFDLGPEPFAAAVGNSKMPVLCANAILEGRKAGTLDRSRSPFGNIQPFVMKEVGGIKIAIVGITTPGLPYWFQPAFTKGFEPTDPVAAAVAGYRDAKAAGADAVILSVHMGTKERGDDFANHVAAIAAAVPQAAVILAGHTHKDIPSQMVNGVLYTQANYYGLNAGKTDLLFDPHTRQLISATAETKRMDASVETDPAILSLAAKDLEDSAAAMAKPAGTIATQLSAKSEPGAPSDTERLIGSSILAGLAARRIRVDGVLHGSFSEDDLFPGPKTVEDCWKIIPYENFLLTAMLTPEDLVQVMNEAYSNPRHTSLQLLGLRPKLSGGGGKPKVIGITTLEGRPLEAGRRYTIAMNTFDASSGGQRLMHLRQIVSAPAASAKIQPVQTREILIEFLNARGARGVGLQDLSKA